LHADRRKNRQTDMTKLIVALRCFTKSPKSDKLIMAKMCDVLRRYTRLYNYIWWSVCAFTAYGEFKYVENVVISELLIMSRGRKWSSGN
jgi:hypothetical protein